MLPAARRGPEGHSTADHRGSDDRPLLSRVASRIDRLLVNWVTRSGLRRRISPKRRDLLEYDRRGVMTPISAPLAGSVSTFPGPPAGLRVAHDWGYLLKMPKFRMLKEPVKIPQYVTPEHFAAIYQACDSAVRPKASHYSPSDWWRALITFAYMTGWRVGEPLALRWDDVSLDKGQAITRHADNKGKRDDVALLHPVVVDHLRKLVDFGEVVFYWPHHERTLWADFARIQEAAGIHLPCHEQHEHTPACHLYGFHDLRRAFATLNAETMTADALQSLMRHRSYSTTQRYINLANQVNRAVEGLHVPEVLRTDTD